MRQLIRLRARGFTLIELLVVLAILGATALIILPEMRGTFEGALLRASARKLVSVCELARSRAVAWNLPLKVTLDTSRGVYRIEPLRRSSSERAARAVSARGGEGRWDRRIAVQVRAPDESASLVEGAALALGALEEDAGGFDPGDNSLVFYPDGTAEPREIRLTDRDGFQLILRVDRVTGRVELEEGHKP